MSPRWGRTRGDRREARQGDVEEADTRPWSSAESWLAAAVVPGRRWFGLCAAALTLESVLGIGRWAGLAWTAQGLLDHSGPRTVQGLVAFAVAGALAVAAGGTGGRLRQHGARAVATRIRERLLEVLLPPGRRGRDTAPAQAALAMLDLVDDVADYSARVEPVRRSAPLAMIAVLAVTAVVHWPAAVVLLLSTALLPVNMWLAGRFAQDGAERQLAATQGLGAVILDSFRGLATLRELGAVDRRGATLSEAAARLNEATMSVLRRAFLSGLVMDVVITFSIAVNATYIGLSLLGYVHVPHAPTLTLFSGLLVLMICPMYFTPLRARATAYHERERAMSAAGELGDMAAHTPAPALRAPRPQQSESVGISLQAVRFRYPGADRDTLSADVDLPPGRWTAVTGASGAGKTTLLSLVAGLRQPTAGRLWWRTASEQSAPVLGECTWLGQHTVLLDASIGDNVRLGRPGATSTELLAAVEAAGLTAVVERLPDGLATRLGEGGWGVSSGEARRIAIARAWLRGARLWVLDEPTAHLDPDSERDVIAALRRATDRCTVVIATHSFLLAAAADSVLTLEDGVLADPDLVGAA